MVFQSLTMIKNLTQSFLSRQRTLLTLRNKATASSLKDIDIENLEDATGIHEVVEDEESRLAEIELKRNKSGLRPNHRNIVQETIPYSEPVLDHHSTIKYNQKMYGTYGKKSGFNPALCWPSKAEIQDIKEYEKIAFPYTIKEVMEKAALRRQEEENYRQKRQEDIVKKEAKLGQWMRELKDKIAKKEAEANVAKARKDRLVEEVRRHFGFKIDPKDERFKEMLEQKERSEKKAMKEAKRKIKEAKFIAKLQEEKPAAQPAEQQINEDETTEKIK